METILNQTPNANLEIIPPVKHASNSFDMSNNFLKKHSMYLFMSKSPS